MFKRTLRLSCELKLKLKESLHKQVEEFKEVKNLYGEKVVGEVKVSQVLGGMRGINGLFYESSKLDPVNGILLRGHNLFDLVKSLRYKDMEEPLPEALLWLLFTGEIPTDLQIKSVIDNINKRALSLDFEDTDKL
jgi:citrate synthase